MFDKWNEYKEYLEQRNANPRAKFNEYLEEVSHDVFSYRKSYADLLLLGIESPTVEGYLNWINSVK